MPAEAFRLFPFQEESTQALRQATLNWIEYCASQGAPRYGATRIPLLAQLKAVTGSGKTPVLAETIGGLGDAVIFWTTRSSAVVEQTFVNLSGKYRSLLPPGTQIIRDVPSQAIWRDLIDSEQGLTIWVITVASWNEADPEVDAVDARLRLHRQQPDWAGDIAAPWDQLRDNLKRPLWIVSDESHNQSSAQLDQLSGLRPLGFFMASATPVVNDLFAAWATALQASPETKALLDAAQVPIRTRDVVEANLLKTTIEVLDYRSGTEESLDGALEAFRRVENAVTQEGAAFTPRAIYVVERSNPPRGSHEEARPLAIWRYLQSRGVPADEIAVFTDTKVLPDEAHRISSLSQLGPRYRHIIFNQTLQEGWDDPEAYVCYFDGVTRSFIRIRQIVGRVLRQPSARRFTQDELNTATLILQTPAESFDAVITELRAELRLYAPDGQPDFTPVKVKTRGSPLTPVPLRAGLSADDFTLKRHVLQAPEMRPVERKLKTTAARPWPEGACEAPGVGRRTAVSLESGEEITEYLAVLRSARTLNGAFLRRRILQRNRSCVNAIHPDWYVGPAFAQSSCYGSQAQEDLTGLAAEIVEYFEDRVTYDSDPDPDRTWWKVGDYRPRGSEMVEFERSIHPNYSKADFNGDELPFARAIDRIDGVRWLRNASTEASFGYGIPLPRKVGDSSTFYPDFLVWLGACCWAVDTTGRHLLDEKVRGKLIALGSPRMALVVRGEVDLARGARNGLDGWSVVIARPNLQPTVEHGDDLDAVVRLLA